MLEDAKGVAEFVRRREVEAALDARRALVEARVDEDMERRREHERQRVQRHVGAAFALARHAVQELHLGRRQARHDDDVRVVRVGDHLAAELAVEELRLPGLRCRWKRESGRSSVSCAQILSGCEELGHANDSVSVRATRGRFE